jgi:hypothetical protein
MLLVFIFLLLGINISFSQDINTVDSNVDKSKFQLLDYKLKFFKGDTLRYRVASFDSIVIEYGKALTKMRFEMIEIVCDSTSNDGKYYLTQTLLSYIADEATGSTDRVRRTTSPWIKRNVRLVIDSVGNRYSVSVNDSNIYAVSPGGAFQPYLLFPFKETNKHKDESWFVKTIDTLVENGNPHAIENQSSLFRAEEPIDTLGYKSNRFRFIKTANGQFMSISGKDRILVEAIINSSGNFILSNEFCIPVHFFSNIEQKLKITTPEKEAMPGIHLISTDFTIDEFKPSPLRNIINN